MAMRHDLVMQKIRREGSYINRGEGGKEMCSHSRVYHKNPVCGLSTKVIVLHMCIAAVFAINFR